MVCGDVVEFAARIPDKAAVRVFGFEIELHLGGEGKVAVIIGEARDQVMALQCAGFGDEIDGNNVVEI